VSRARTLARAAVLTLLATVGLTAGGLPTERADAASATAADAWFAPELDWSTDAPEGYARRLGETPAAYGIRLSYPVDSETTDRWQRAATAAAAQGAGLILTFEPTRPLDALTTQDAAELAERLDSVRAAYGIRQRVRFAPEMNGSWVAWGQQPTSYVAAFESVASAVHAGTSGAQMVWVPSYGAGYPFDRADGRLDALSPSDEDELDTDDDGRLTEADDPYGPYFPDPDAVDRVGLTLYYFGKGEAAAAAGRDVPLVRNDAPEAGEFAARLDERWGYTVQQTRAFVDRFAAPDRRMEIDTGALFDPAREGDDELAVKRGWWQQVLTEVAALPAVDTVTWLEAERSEAEAGAAEVDWRVTADAGMAAAFRSDLDATGRFVWAPITPPVTPEQGLGALTDAARQDGADAVVPAAWTMAGAAALLIAALIARRRAPRWRYPETDEGRDLRWDALRGIGIIVGAALLLTTLDPLSATTGGAGGVTGAEVFLAISGIVLATGYRRRLNALGVGDALSRGWRRAGRLYATTLVVVIAVFALGFVPFVNTTGVSTLADTTSGRVYDLYPNAERLLDYPPPAYAVWDLLLLRMGPWPLIVLGVFIALSVIAPLLLWLLRRRLWWLVVALSLAGFAVSAALPGVARLPTQFDAVYPLLAWQLPFVLGLVVGFHRDVLSRFSRRRGAGAVLLIVVLVWAAVLGSAATVLPGAAPWLGVGPGGLSALRLLDSAALLGVGFAVLTWAWRPLARALSPVWLPFGQASLGVFCAQVFVLIAFASVPALATDDPAVRLIAAAAGVLALWAGASIAVRLRPPRAQGR
jgi:hypothetical protein